MHLLTKEELLRNLLISALSSCLYSNKIWLFLSVTVLCGFFGKLSAEVLGRSFSKFGPFWVPRQELSAYVYLMKHLRWKNNSRMVICFIKGFLLKLWWFSVSQICLYLIFFHSADQFHFCHYHQSLVQRKSLQLRIEAHPCLNWSVKHGHSAE